jgi:hypothetical protein
MYNKDGTRLQNKGFNLIVCLIFWTLKWYMYDTLTSPFLASFPNQETQPFKLIDMKTKGM